MISQHELIDNYKSVKDRIAASAIKTGRQPDDIMMVAVTKYAQPEQIRQIVEMGQVDLGESRVQQLQQRVPMMAEFMERREEINPHAPECQSGLRWHMIGSLQRNKVKPALPLVNLIHSCDSLRLAEELQTQAQKAELDIEVLLQVNTSGELSKSGISPPAVPHLAEQMETMFNLRVRGIMAMAPYTENPEEVRPVFERTAELFYEMKKLNLCDGQFNILSMGMSNDFEVAIECGANMLRIGSAIFGPREAEPEAD